MSSHADRQPAAQIKIPGLRLVWRPQSAPPEVKWRLGFFGHIFKGTPHRLIILISLRGLLIWGTGTALAVYFLGAAALAWIWERNPYNQVSYTDMVLPTRWSRLPEKRGQGQIDEGIHELRTGNYITGLMLLNHGLGLRPADLRGRMVLAQVFINAGFLHRGFHLLKDGLAFGLPPKSYREALFHLTNYLEDYPGILEMADQIEQLLSPADTTTRRWLLNQRVSALEKLQRDDEIERLRNELKNTPSFALEAAWARLQARRGRPADALREIARDPGRFGVPADRYQLQISLALAAGDQAALAEALHGWQSLEPLNPAPRVEEIIAVIRNSGDVSAVTGLLQRFLYTFTREPEAPVMLLQKLDELPDIRWLNLGWREASEAGVISLNLRLLHVQGLIGHGDIESAQQEYNRARDLIQAGHVRDGGWAEGTRILLDLLTADSPTGRSQLIAYCTRLRLNPAAYRFILRGLRARGMEPIAAEVATIARNRFPSFQDGNGSTALASSSVAPETPGSNKGFEKLSLAEAKVEQRRLEADLQAGRWTEARARLGRLEHSPAPELQQTLLLNRIQLHGVEAEETELTAALQLYLSHPGADLAALRRLAEQWKTTAQEESALTLTRIITEKLPSARWARDLRKELELKLNVVPADAAGPKPGN